MHCRLRSLIRTQQHLLKQPSCGLQRCSALYNGRGPLRWFSDQGNQNDLNVIVDLCVVPMKNAKGASVSEEIVIIEKLIDESGLSHMMHGYGTNIEGPWDEVFALVKRCHTVLHEQYGIPRITTTIKCGTRTDKSSSIKYKIKSVEDKM
eukprot:373005_1